MSFEDRIHAARQFDERRFLPFHIDGQLCGWIKPVFAQELSRWPDIFSVAGDVVALRDSLVTADNRTSALTEVTRALHEQGLITGWRNELYPVAADFGGTPLLAIERAAAYPFGIRTRAAHLTGYVHWGTACRMWIARRAASKPIEPLKLDNLVGGGVALGFTPEQTILKECGEEAGIPVARARKAREKSLLISTVEVVDGLHWEALHSFDLQLDEDFRPVNRDGEVAEFQLLPIRDVRELIRDTTEFTVDAALVALDFMLRHEFAATSTTERSVLMAALYGAPFAPT